MQTHALHFTPHTASGSKKYGLFRVAISSLDPGGDVHAHKHTYTITNRDYGIAGAMGASQAACTV